MTTMKHNLIQLNQSESRFKYELGHASERMDTSEMFENEISVLSDTMTSRLSISNIKQGDTPIESKPASSLSDLAYHHLQRSVSGRAQSDQESSNNKFTTDNGNFKPNFSGFVIPFLSKPEEDCIRSQNSKIHSIKCPAKLTDLLGAKGVDSNDSVNSSEDWVIDLSCAIRNPELRCQNSSPYKRPKQLIHVDNSNETVECTKSLLPPCTLDISHILKMKFSYANNECSCFGRILCHTPKQLSGPYIPFRKKYQGNIQRFRFDKPSPDDIVVTNQERKI